MPLPMLPGNNFSSNLGREKFHKSHHFDQSNKVSMMVGEKKPGIGGIPLAGQDIRPANTVYPKGEGSCLPSWVAFDKQVLSFDSYFQEAVHEKREEQFRVRPCKVYFYLEDDSIQVVEPRTKNSQMPQGTIIKRHRIPKPAPCDDQYYVVDDFNVGNELNFYGRVFKLTACDDFTKNFLMKIGFRVNQPTQIPDDPYTNFRKSMGESMQPLRPYERKDTLKQFLDHDRHVLRFNCYWDDRDAMYGDVHDMILHYFLSDDTIEIREVIPPNAGKDTNSTFLKRGRLPKDSLPVPLPGQKTDRTVLNVFGSASGGGRYVLDSLKTGAREEECYCDSDLSIGAIINIYGRRLKLVDCDEFTKHYYKTKYGVECFAKIDYKEPEPAAPNKVWPPYNGFGGEEDSLSSCQPTLQPKPPQKDFVKFMEKDRCGYDSNVLRYYAKLATDKVVDQDRRFIISYFLSDDTMKVYEPVQRNSGHLGGTFLERQRVKRPDQPQFSTRLSEYYQANDLYIGGIVSIHNFFFEVIDADEYALDYMEKNKHQFPISAVNNILSKLKEGCTRYGHQDLLQMFEKHAQGGGFMHYGQLRSLLMDITGGHMQEHEIMSVARYYGEQKEAPVDVHLFSYLVQESLRRHNFDIFMNKLPEAFLQRDAEKCNYLNIDEIMAVIKSVHVPASIDQIKILICGLPKDEQERVNYQELLRFLNWKQHPVAPPPSYTIGEFDPSRKLSAEAVKRSQERVCYIDYMRLFNDLRVGCPDQQAQHECNDGQGTCAVAVPPGSTGANGCGMPPPGC